MSLIAYFIFFLLGVILIETIIIIVMAFIIKRMKNKEKGLFIQKQEERKKFKRELLKKGREIDEKINKATDRNDILNIYNELMFDDADPD